MARLRQVGERLLHQEGGLAGSRAAGDGVDLGFDGLRGGPRHEPQQVDPVAAREVRRGGGRCGLEPGARERAGRLAVHDQQVEQQPPLVPALLGLELVEQRPGRQALLEERHHTVQLRQPVGPVHELAQPRRVERLVALLADRLDEAVLDLLLDRQLGREVEHLHRAAEVALVELLGGRVHQVAVAARDLDRVLGQRHDLLHRAQLVRRRQLGRVGGDVFRHRPVAELLAEAAEHVLGAGRDARVLEPQQVALELELARGLGGGGRDRLRGDAAARDLAAGPEQRLAAQVLLHQREPPQPRRGRRDRGRCRLRLSLARARRGLAPHHLGLAQSGERAAEAVAVGAGRAGLRQERARLAQEGKQAGVVHELELADHAQLVERVLQHVDGRELGLHGLEHLAPAPQLGRGRLGGRAHEDVHRVRDHQRRNAVGEVLHDLAERRAQLGARVCARRERLAQRPRRGRVVGGEGGFLRRDLAARSRHAQRVQHRARVGVAGERVLGHGAHHHRHDAGRQLGNQLAERLGVAVHDREQHRRDGGAGERPLAREHFVEHRAEREDVGARGRALALRLLGRHVVGRAHHDAAGGGVLGAPGEPEIHDLDLPVRQHVHVAGLEVAVHHALRVREGQPVEDLLHHRELVLERAQLPLREQLAQVLALEQLHGHVGHAALLAEVVDRDDVGVVELGRGAGLALEALAGALVLAQLAEHDLDRHVAPEHGVVGAEDLAHGARADLPDDGVLADLAELHPSRDDRNTQGFGAREPAPRDATGS